MNTAEIFIINRYAAAELAGSVLLGRMARKTDDPHIYKQLVWHCAEEARHALLWIELIEKLELSPTNIHDGSRKGYFAYADEIKDIIDFLCFVHVYELRVPFHFAIHKEWTSLEPVKKLLSKLIKEEGSHLSWIREHIRKVAFDDRERVISALKKFIALEEKTYAEDIEMLERSGPEGKDFAQLIKKALPRRPRVNPDEIIA